MRWVEDEFQVSHLQRFLFANEPVWGDMLLLGLAWMIASRGGRVELAGLAAGIYFALLLVAGHGWLCWRLPAADQLILPIVAGLSALGQLMITRLSPDSALRQAVWVTVVFHAINF